ncbi:MAG: hypothetical protein HKN79_01460, partial [Flavobacteriales bacterium]|nr:hypothetical protein [Flavobacteriales bacterium]
LPHIWVIRTDSLGCIEPGCHLISGLQEQVIGLQGSMGIAPNPWQHGNPIQLLFTAPSSGIMPYQEKTTRLVLYDLQGRLVYEQDIAPQPGPSTSSGTYHVELHPPSLGTGKYILHWMSLGGAWYDSVKLVVE